MEDEGEETRGRCGHCGVEEKDITASKRRKKPKTKKTNKNILMRSQLTQPETEDRNNKSRSRPFHLPDTRRSNRNSSSGMILPGTEMTSPKSASSGVLPGGQWRVSYCLFALGSWREREEA